MIPAKEIKDIQEEESQKMFQEGNSTFNSNNFMEEELVQIIVPPKNDLIAFLSENNSLFELDLEMEKEKELELK